MRSACSRPTRSRSPRPPACGTTRQAVQRSADDLLERRLATAEPNPDHRTSPYIRLTAEGHALLERINTRAAQSRRQWLPDAGSIDLEAAHDVIRTLLACLPAD